MASRRLRDNIVQFVVTDQLGGGHRGTPLTALKHKFNAHTVPWRSAPQISIGVLI